VPPPHFRPLASADNEPDATRGDFEPFCSDGETGGLRRGRRRLGNAVAGDATAPNEAGSDTECLAPVSPTAERRRKAPGGA